MKFLRKIRDRLFSSRKPEAPVQLPRIPAERNRSASRPPPIPGAPVSIVPPPIPDRPQRVAKATPQLPAIGGDCLDTSARSPVPETTVLERPPRAATSNCMNPEDNSLGTAGSKPSKHSRSPARDPYLVQVGLDFGTSFSKCVIREIYRDKVWVHVPPSPVDSRLPFLIPSVIIFKDDRFFLSSIDDPDFEKHGLLMPKIALLQVAAENFSDPVLANYRRLSGARNEAELREFVHLSVVFCFVAILMEARESIASKLPGFGDHSDDEILVNLAIPISSAEDDDVSMVFQRALYEAKAYDECSLEDGVNRATLAKELRNLSGKVEEEQEEETCYVYPEASANTQGFAQSWTTGEGLYFFVDTGAGTVDVSCFALARPDGDTLLTYLYSTVVPLGSSLIEEGACRHIQGDGVRDLISMRRRKESGEHHPAIVAAKEELYRDLYRDLCKSLYLAKGKLPTEKGHQINDLKMIFGGGGHCANPYERAALGLFNYGGIFRHQEITLRKRRGDALHVGMPLPADLDLGKFPDQHTAFARLSVAYGLSFERTNLAEFRFPKDVPIPEKIRKPRKDFPSAPTKDDC